VVTQLACLKHDGCPPGRRPSVAARALQT
jgi:hypothetical protein